MVDNQKHQTLGTPAGGSRLEQLLYQQSVDFSELRHQLIACGMAAEAAQCHSWSLLPPAPDLWQQKRCSWLRRLTGAEATVSVVELPTTEPVHRAEPEHREAATALELQTIQALLDGGEVKAACIRIARLGHDSGLAPYLCNRAAMLLTQLGDFWEAERWYRTSLVQHTEQPQSWFALASLLLQQQAWDEALEAAVVGLQLEPTHPWGLKLQQHALVGLQAQRTLGHLGAQGQLPFPLAGFDNSHFQGFAAVDPDSPAPLTHKLVLQNLLLRQPLQDHCRPDGQVRIWCIGPTSHRIVEWLAAQRLLHPDAVVQVFADPDADHSILGRDLPESRPGPLLEPSLPLYRLTQQEQTPQLMIISPIQASSLPLVTARLIRLTAPLLLDSRCDLELPGHQVVLQTAMWRLLAPQNST